MQIQALLSKFKFRNCSLILIPVIAHDVFVSTVPLTNFQELQIAIISLVTC